MAQAQSQWYTVESYASQVLRDTMNLQEATNLFHACHVKNGTIGLLLGPNPGTCSDCGLAMGNEPARCLTKHLMLGTFTVKPMTNTKATGGE